MSKPMGRDVKCGLCGGHIPEASDGGLGRCGCLDALEHFSEEMRHELAANQAKGGRYLWTADPIDGLLAQVADHYAKLHIAARELQRRRDGMPARPVPWDRKPLDEMVLEFAADTANMAFMVVDRFGLLEDGDGIDATAGARR